jgi:hypothetical protein
LEKLTAVYGFPSVRCQELNGFVTLFGIVARTPVALGSHYRE